MCINSNLKGTLFTLQYASFKIVITFCLMTVFGLKEFYLGLELGFELCQLSDEISDRE